MVCGGWRLAEATGRTTPPPGVSVNWGFAEKTEADWSMYSPYPQDIHTLGSNTMSLSCVEFQTVLIFYPIGGQVE